MPVLSKTSGYILVAIFGLVMVGLTYVLSRDPRWKETGAGFLVAGREVPWTIGATSIAASWVWAPALFVSVQKAYELGLPGIFWFTVPNILALVIFAVIAPRVREKIPGGYTLPEWIRYRLDDQRLHYIYLIPYIWYQVMAVCVQIFVGGLMLEFLTGIPLNIVMFLMLVIGLAYSLISGLRTSVITDFIQMAFIVVGLAVVIPWLMWKTGDAALVKGLGGLKNNTSILNPQVAFSFGIVTSIGLIAGALSDQQYWQRSFAIKREDLRMSFVWGGILFGLVPIALSVLGFLAANPDLGIPAPEGTALPMIGISTVVELLPNAVAIFFVVMLLGGLTSTLDSGLCAASSLYAIDMTEPSDEEHEVLRKERIGLKLSEEEQKVRESMDEKATKNARVAMFGIAAIGLATAYAVQHLFTLTQLWWIFNGFASCFVVPTILSVFWDRLSARGAFYGILCSLIGMVFFVYGNWVKSDIITVTSALSIVLVGALFCVLFRRDTPWKGESEVENLD